MALLGALCASSTSLAKTYLVPPAVGWDVIAPYVNANIVAELRGDAFDVFVCPAHTDRSVIDPFDEALSDFARALITEQIHDDSRFAEAIEATTQAFRERVPALSPAELEGYRALFWRSLSASGDVVPRLKAAFEEAKAKGRLRCRICERDPSYAPAARRMTRENR